MNRFKAAIASVALLLGLTLIAPTVVMAQTDQIGRGLCTGANLKFTENPTDECIDTDAATRLTNIVHKIVNLLSALVGIVAVIMIIIGGLRYITSGGNDTSVTSAKNTILYAIIGLIIVALAQLIVRFTLNKIVNS